MVQQTEAPKKAIAVTVEFYNYGQSLQWMLVDVATSKITDSGPLMSTIWHGVYIDEPLELKVNDYVRWCAQPITGETEDVHTLTSPVFKIKKHYEPR